MAYQLEAPKEWDDLYQARGDDVNLYRPFLTGDVFRGVPTVDSAGEKKRDVILVQHPCSLRIDGVRLVPKLLVAKVQQFPVVEREDWTGHVRIMPLPELLPEEKNPKKRHSSARFEDLFIVTPEQLSQGVRHACMSPLGINTLMQRWVFNSTRVTVPTTTFHERNAAVFEEVDLIEEWCEERAEAMDPVDASAECVAWLRQPSVDGGVSRQLALREAQQRSPIRRQMRTYLKATPPA
ncbi:hypothetical protein [Streptomyces subrutilus]|uniref:hypothetical protein n=1 Tax=Streptomyces subrutilus TaxID=36818 RepID=UPI0034066572